MDFLDTLQRTPGFNLTLLVSAIAVGIILLFKYISEWKKWYTMPGPWGLPIVGYYPFLQEDTYKQLAELAKDHGEIFSINIGGMLYVHLGSLKAIRESVIKHPDCFPGRSAAYGVLNCALGDGLAFLEGEQWKLVRKSTLQAFRELGLGIGADRFREPLEMAVNDALNLMRKNCGETIDISSTLLGSYSSALCKMLLGWNVKKEVEERLLTEYLTIVLAMHGITSILNGNVARYFLLPRRRYYKELLSAKEVMNTLLGNIVEEHEATIDVHNPRDFIDLYLRQRIERFQKGDSSAVHFTNKALVSTLLQVFGDGSHAVTGMTCSILEYLAQKADVQDKIYQEITEVIGKERAPTWEDKTSLHYTYAAVKELYRVSEFIGMLPTVECRRETVALGVTIPKGSIMLANGWAIGRDPSIYEDPDIFRPERYLQGNDSTAPAGDHFYYFGAGRRVCPGESLTIMHSFVYIASILQHFALRPPKEHRNAEPTTYENSFSCSVTVLPR